MIIPNKEGTVVQLENGRLRAEIIDYQQFKPKEACERLHDFMKEL